MHLSALFYVERFRSDAPISVLDLGGRDVNGTTRHLFPNAEYVALDITDGPGVDIIANAATWRPDREFDVVVSTELFEHTAEWPEILGTALRACRPGGRLVATMAGPGRPAHGQHGAPGPADGEHYANVDPDQLAQVLADTGWVDVQIDVGTSPADVRCTALRPA